MGSEGRLGVITEVTLRVRQRPQETVVEAALVADFETGLGVSRELVTRGLPLTLLRLSDGPETEVAMAVGLAAGPAAKVVRTYLRLRGMGRGACLMLYGTAGDGESIRNILGCARSTLRQRGAVILGRKPGRTWLRDRFRHPYLREALLERGWATDTLETAVPWSALGATRGAVADAIASSLDRHGGRVAVLCHLSHPYRDGASLYFTFFFATAADPEATIAGWARIKRAATAALVSAGATLSHHHGIGSWHAPWLGEEIGADGRQLLAAAARQLDPDGILNPHVLLDAADRLEA
jgi:alkyldihydroxyacetonephosphate synthase